jgi:ribonuclease P protein component
MLPKKNRADKKAVERVFKEGKIINSPFLTFRFVPVRDGSRRISVIAPKSVAKLAVKRNLLRRRGYDALKKYLPQFPAGIIGVLIFKKYQTDIMTIENEIKNILRKIN